MIVHQLALDVVGSREVLVDGLGVEDPVGEGAVVGGAVSVAREDGADLGLGEAPVQIGDVLGGALSGAHDDDPLGVRPLQALDLGEQVGVVPDAVAPLDTLGHLRAKSRTEDEVSGSVDDQFVSGAGRHVEVLHDAVALDGLHGDDLVAVRDHVVDLGRGPLEVVVELDAQREEVLVIDEIDQPALALQVAEEAVFAGRVAERHQVLEEGHLHGRVVDQHAAVPAETRLTLEEVGGDRFLPSDACVVLAERYRHGHIGRPEADAYEVVDQRCVTRRNLRHVTPIVRERS